MAFYAYGAGQGRGHAGPGERAPGSTWRRSSAYSDSATDLPMLEAVGHPVAVNPDRPLARLARERGWETRQFTKPVRLRDRMTVRTPVVTTSLALAAGAAVLLWRTHRLRDAAPGCRRRPAPGPLPGALDGLSGSPVPAPGAPERPGPAAVTGWGPGRARVRPSGAAWRRRRRG